MSDVRGHGSFVAIAADDREPLRLVGREPEVADAHAFVERTRLRFEAVPLPARLARRGATLRDLDREVEEKGLVGPRAADGEVRDGAELREVGAVPVTLVRERRIEEPVD